MPPYPPVLMPVRLGRVADGHGTDGPDPVPWPEAWPDESRSRAAAVLVLVAPAPDGSAEVILTERAHRGGHHSGEVSFPGGQVEPDDEGAAGAALREALEEVALDALAAGVRVVGELETFRIPVSGFLVTPVVAVAARRPVLEASPEEVARILHAPLAAFLPGAEIRIVERAIRGWYVRYGAYRFQDLTIWGATARILGQLGAALTTELPGRVG